MLNLKSKKFGRLTGVSRAFKKNGSWYWKFECDCGNLVVKKGSLVSTGNTKSCGCLQKESRLSGNNKKHGLSKHPLYNMIVAIKRRCYNPNSIEYSRYGGRGIKVFSDWVKNSGLFLHWVLENLGERPPGFQIDRIDNNGDYEPGNLKWSSPKENGRNKRNNLKVIYQGKSYVLSELAEKLKISYKSLWKRVNSGFSIEESIKKGKNKNFDVDY